MYIHVHAHVCVHCMCTCYILYMYWFTLCTYCTCVYKAGWCARQFTYMYILYSLLIHVHVHVYMCNKLSLLMRATCNKLETVLPRDHWLVWPHHDSFFVYIYMYTFVHVQCMCMPVLIQCSVVVHRFQSWFDFDVNGEDNREKIIAQEREQNVLSTLHQVHMYMYVHVHVCTVYVYTHSIQCNLFLLSCFWFVVVCFVLFCFIVNHFNCCLHVHVHVVHLLLVRLGKR